MKVFISHAAADREMANLLLSRLKSEGYETFSEAEDISPGDNWLLKSGKALENSDAMIVLLSPDSARSESVGREIEYAISSPQFRGRVIPVLLKPTKDVPWILKKMHFVEAAKDKDETADRVAAMMRKLPVAA